MPVVPAFAADAGDTEEYAVVVAAVVWASRCCLKEERKKHVTMLTKNSPIIHIRALNGLWDRCRFQQEQCPRKIQSEGENESSTVIVWLGA